jgi:YHS domain-containing protein
MKFKFVLYSLFIFMFLAIQSYAFSQTESCCSDEKKEAGLMESCEHMGSGQSKTDSNQHSTTTINASAPKSTLTCPVSNEVIEEGKGVEFTYYGTKYTFKNESSAEKFKSEPMDYISGALICPVMGDPALKEFNVTHAGVKYYLCCENCMAKFEKNPEKFINKSNSN